MLERLGVGADVVTNGSQAITAVANVRYDLVLMDVEMPEMDGLTATQKIRNRLPADCQPAIFGLTAHATTEYRDICLRAGMNGCLTKPLEREKLRAIVLELSALHDRDCGLVHTDNSTGQSGAWVSTPSRA
jgi:CheY-like chemotaxis protein